MVNLKGDAMKKSSFQHEFIDDEGAIKFAYGGRMTKPLNEGQLAQAIQDIECNEDKFKSLEAYKNMLGVFMYALTLLRVYKASQGPYERAVRNH